ncbi:MAG: TM1266 family iron-only hydrogenase system putative regulator [Patescibacteria group bacterium]
MAKKLGVMGIRVSHRASISPAVQEVLSDFGDEILMRAGVPGPGREHGLISLIVEADEEKLGALARRLEAVNGVDVKTMVF